MIRIVRRGKPFTIEIRGAKFSACRLSVDEEQELADRFIKGDGSLQSLKYSVEKLKRCITGWEEGAVGNMEGVPQPFDLSLIEHLPDDVRNDLLSAVGGGLPFGNSSTQTSTASGDGSSGTEPTQG